MNKLDLDRPESISDFFPELPLLSGEDSRFPLPLAPSQEALSAASLLDRVEPLQNSKVLDSAATAPARVAASASSAFSSRKRAAEEPLAQRLPRKRSLQVHAPAQHFSTLLIEIFGTLATYALTKWHAEWSLRKSGQAAAAPAVRLEAPRRVDYPMAALSKELLDDNQVDSQIDSIFSTAYKELLDNQLLTPQSCAHLIQFGVLYLNEIDPEKNLICSPIGLSECQVALFRKFFFIFCHYVCSEQKIEMEERVQDSIDKPIQLRKPKSVPGKLQTAVIERTLNLVDEMNAVLNGSGAVASESDAEDSESDYTEVDSRIGNLTKPAPGIFIKPKAGAREGPY